MLKKNYILIFLCISSFCFAETLFWGKSTTDLLRIREEPYLDSKTIDHLSINEKVELIERTRWKEDIDGFSTYWIHIQKEDLSGWCYGGYIEEIDPNSNIQYLTANDQIYSPEKFIEYSTEVFIKYPFIDRAEILPPISVKQIDEIYEIYGEPKSIDIQEIENRYDENITDKQYFISTDYYYFYYYYAQTKDIYYLNLFQISKEPSELRFGIFIGMAEDKLLSICGKPDHINNYENNYELCYVSQNDEQINFSLSNGILEAINFWN